MNEILRLQKISFFFLVLMITLVVLAYVYDEVWICSCAVWAAMEAYDYRGRARETYVLKFGRRLS